MMYKCKYFKITELVSPAVYKVWGEKAWMFLDEDILKELDLIRETWGKPLLVNNGSSYTQSGLRSNIDPLVRGKSTLYLSAHCLGKGFDIKPLNGDHRGLWEHVKKLISTGKLKRFKRLEDRASAPTWCHVDAFQTADNKLQIFKG